MLDKYYMEQLKVLIINNNKGIVNAYLKILKREGYIDIIELNKKYFKTIVSLKKELPKMEVKEKVINILNLIGMPKNRVGYEYIISAVLYLHKNGEIQDICIKEIYNALFYQYNKSVCSIEKAIRKAVECTFSYGNIDEIYKIFDNMVSKDSGNLSNKKFIYGLAKKIV